MLEPRIEVTKDGSHTLIHAKYKAHYHSIAGAVEESNFIYLNTGFHYILNTFQMNEISVLEMGLGTALNAFNTLLAAEKLQIKTNYVGIEKYPLSQDIINQLNYVEVLQAKPFREQFDEIHGLEAGVFRKITPCFNFKKQHIDFFKIEFYNQFHVIYFDAFSPNEQPDLWTASLFSLLYKALKPKGILVTYCSKGNAKRALREAGFIVKRLPGPPSKRHILRATKA